MTTTRLDAPRYLDLLHEDGELLLALADGSLDRPAPACDGWTVRDVVDHLGMVYGHKIAALELGRRPEPGEWAGPPPGADVVDWCHGLLHRLAHDLAHRSAQDHAWTWWEPEQTAGFWQRRMALETAVHRVDVELARGTASPVAADLAVDGIDEMVCVMLADAGVADTAGPTSHGELVGVLIDGVDVRGAASDVLLWLWGRVAEDNVRIDGDGPALRRLLAQATQ